MEEGMLTNSSIRAQAKRYHHAIVGVFNHMKYNELGESYKDSPGFVVCTTDNKYIVL